MNPAKIELRIEELVLDGFDPADRDRIAGSLKSELERLFAEGGLPPSLARRGEIGYLDSGAFEVGPALEAEAVGARMAQAIHGGLIS